MSCKIEKRCLTLPRIENTIINKGYYHSNPKNVINPIANQSTHVFIIK